METHVVLAFATTCDRAVLTINRYNFIRLHKQQPHHSGIIVCTENPNFERLATKIHEAVPSIDSLQGQLIRVTEILSVVTKSGDRTHS